MINEMRRAARVEISLGAIRENFLAIRALTPESEAIACIKADAYGHGIVKVAWELVRAGAEYLGVATIDEAVALRGAGIRTPIVLLSAAPRGNVRDVVDQGLTTVVTTYTDARLLSSAQTRFGAPRKELLYFAALETGMGRLGFMPTAHAVDEIVNMQALPGIRMAGVFSHFASADDFDLTFSRSQLAAFEAFNERLREAGVEIGKRTMANSAAVISLPESRFEIVRPGIALYGIYPSAASDRSVLTLKPAMTVKTDIIYLKKTPPGFPVSYGSHFVTQRESLIATLPIGYGDGLSRNASGKTRVLVRGQFAPVIGTICMDQCMADVTDIRGVVEYDEAVVMGSQGEYSIPAEELAQSADTIPYETLCRFGQRLPRRYID